LNMPCQIVELECKKMVEANMFLMLTTHKSYETNNFLC
jgi:hypothetical protein